MKKENLKSNEVQMDSSKTNNDKGYPLLKPKIDVVFQSLFSKNNPKITKAFVEALLGEKINSLEINNEKDLSRLKPSDKLGSLDLELSVNNYEKIDVEIQLVKQNDFTERLLYYFSKLYQPEVKIGKEYSVAKRVVIVAIIDFAFDITKNIEKMDTIWRLYEQDNPHLLLTNKIELVIIELGKAKEMYLQNKNNEKAQWMLFLDDPNSEEVQKEIMKNNKDIEDAVVTVKEMSEEEELQMLADLRLKAIMDEKSIYAAGVDDGKKEGIELGKKTGIELGKKTGIELGKKTGIELGKKAGIEEERERLRKKLLEKGMSEKDVEEILAKEN